jgi:hypothetical protein
MERDKVWNLDPICQGIENLNLFLKSKHPLLS